VNNIRSAISPAENAKAEQATLKHGTGFSSDLWL
jgi:hypothetical protein